MTKKPGPLISTNAAILAVAGLAVKASSRSERGGGAFGRCPCARSAAVLGCGFAGRPRPVDRGLTARRGQPLAGGDAYATGAVPGCAQRGDRLSRRGFAGTRILSLATVTDLCQRRGFDSRAALASVLLRPFVRNAKCKKTKKLLVSLHLVLLS